MIKQGIGIILIIVVTYVTGIFLIIDARRTKEVKVLATIQPLDLTITYCESCKRCTTLEQLDAIEYEQCVTEIEI